MNLTMQVLSYNDALIPFWKISEILLRKSTGFRVVVEEGTKELWQRIVILYNNVSVITIKNRKNDKGEKEKVKFWKKIFKGSGRLKGAVKGTKMIYDFELNDNTVEALEIVEDIKMEILK